MTHGKHTVLARGMARGATRRIGVAALLCACMAQAWLAPAAQAADNARSRAANAGNYRPDEVLVRVNPDSGASITAINATYGTSTLAALSSIGGAYRLRTPAGQTPVQVSAAMEGDARLLYAHPNFINEHPEANPRTSKVWGGEDAGPYQGQYAGAMLHLSTAHAIATGAGIVVAVIDTGVQLAHPALAAKLTVERYDFIDGDSTPDDSSNGLDDDGDTDIDEAAGHGTHVAGIVSYMAPDARIMPLRALDSDGIGDTLHIADAIHYATAHGARVINLSLGTSADAGLIEDAVREASLAGVFVVSAAGNLDSTEKQFPGADGCALGVTAIGQSDVKSSFSNYGSWVDMSAPGEGIPSMLPPNGYGTWSGTSMASPFAAGLAALILSKQPQLNPRQIASLMATTAKDIDPLNPNHDGDLGLGRIDAGAALTFLQAGTAIPDVGSMIGTSCIGTQPPAPTVTPATPQPALTPSPTGTRRPLTRRSFLPLLRR